MFEKVLVLTDEKKSQDLYGLLCISRWCLYPVVTLEELQSVLKTESKVMVAVTYGLLQQYGELFLSVLRPYEREGVGLMVINDSEDEVPDIFDDSVKLIDVRQGDGRLLRLLQKKVTSVQHGKNCSYVAVSAAGEVPSGTEPENFGELNAFVGISAERNKLLSVVQKYAACNTRIMLTGESGTGKSFLAELIHKVYTLEQKKNALREGKKAETGYFTKCNVASLGSYLVESEIFGHVKGAFTGADRQKDGYIAECHNGTLFFDEVTDIPMEQQVKFLDFIQTGNYCRVGSSEVQHSDARIISATHDDIQLALHQGKIREDLLYRLAVKIIHIPSLNERREDIPSISDSILSRFNKARNTQRWFTESAYEGLMAHDWTGGNIRSLEGYIERMFVEASADALSYDDVCNAEQLFA